MRAMTSREGSTSSIFQPLEAPTSMNSMKRRMWPLWRKCAAMASMSPSLVPRLTTMLTLIGPRPTDFAASMPSSTLATG